MNKCATALALVSVAAMNGGAASAPVDAFDLMSLYADGMNLYGFTGSNPVNYNDPLGLSSADFDYFEEGDAVVADIMGSRAATAGAVYDSIKSSFNTAQLLGELMISMLPGGDALILMAQLAKGNQVSFTDIMFAIASFAPGGGSAKIAFGTLGAFGDFQRGYKAAKAGKAAGRLGSFAHRKKVMEVTADLERKGWTIKGGGGRPELLTGDIPGRVRGRYPDIIATKNGRTLRVQVGKRNKRGDPVIRERRALDDLRGVQGPGNHTIFISYE